MSALLALACGAPGQPDAEPEVTLAAAASLRRVAPDLVRAFGETRRGATIVVTYGGSGTLRAQIEAGSPIDGVLLAAPAPVDQLIRSGRADPASRRVVATNRLVLVGPATSAGVTFETIERLPSDALVAIGEPETVPAGRYAEEALRALGKWEALRGRLVYGGDVAAVLTYARRGEVAAAIVYETDAVGIQDVEVLDIARGPWAPSPQIVAAVTDGGRGATRAREFLEFAGSPAGAEIFRRHGFGTP